MENICLRGKQVKPETLPREDQLTSAILFAELHEGAHRSASGRCLEKIEANVRPRVSVLPFDADVAPVDLLLNTGGHPVPGRALDGHSNVGGPARHQAEGCSYVAWLTQTSCRTKFMYMRRRNVTITLDEETARWARIEAARRDTSVSSLVGELLREHMLREENYGEAMERYLSGRAVPLKREGTYPSREEVHRRGE